MVRGFLAGARIAFVAGRKKEDYLAHLYYMSLPGVGDWDKALKQSGAQFRPYFQYLDTSIRAADQRKPMLGWRLPTSAERKVFQKRLENRHEQSLERARRARKRRNRRPPRLPTGEWIVLEAPPWRPEEPDDTFDAFLDARNVHDDRRCGHASRLEIRDHDREGRALLLERLPIPVPARRDDEGKHRDEDDETARQPTPDDPYGPLIWLAPNTYTLKRQLFALRDLENKPASRLAPLLRLVSKRAHWDEVTPEYLLDKDWVFLRPLSPGEALRDGTEEQRHFVRTALATPDFAILEGPPGSGKTTAICELIAQLARQGKRILLVASTHVAVDNVLERLIAWQDDPATEEKLVLPVRIGEESRVSSDDIRPWTYSRLRMTWRDELLDFLDTPSDVDRGGDEARAMLRGALHKGGRQDDSPLSRLLLESANLVCGTTIGILQHPAIKAARRGEQSLEPFDVMILDEASKTTFTEFLVPAIHARCWIVVGDIKQLSPYVEEQDLAENLRRLVAAEHQRAALQAFMTEPVIQEKYPKTRTLLMTDDGEAGELMRDEAAARGVRYAYLDEVVPETLRDVAGAIPELLYADLVFGSSAALERFEHRLPPDLTPVAPLPELPAWNSVRRVYLDHLRRNKQRPYDQDEELDWADEVAWRLIRSYELRQNERESERYQVEIKRLIPRSLDEAWFEWRDTKPKWHEDRPETADEALERELTNIRRVAMPSILELLQVGFERLPNWRDGVALNDGLPEEALAQRLVSLRYQHRMHPHISSFSREQFYASRGQRDEEPLLQDAAGMEARRAWGYSHYARRALWLEVVPGHRRGNRRNANPGEVEQVMRELQSFIDWAMTHSPPAGSGRERLWHVAVLTFYRGQEAFLRQELQKLSGLYGNTRNFRLPRQKPHRVHVTLCTVDRFQGHEADLVLLSFVKSGRGRSVGFLNSPNRLNVALTRARFQIVLIGHRSYFTKCNSPLLQTLSESDHYGGKGGGDIGWEENP